VPRESSTPVMPRGRFDSKAAAGFPEDQRGKPDWQLDSSIARSQTADEDTSYS